MMIKLYDVVIYGPTDTRRKYLYNVYFIVYRTCPPKSNITVDLSNTTFFEMDWHIQKVIMMGENLKEYNTGQADPFELKLINITRDGLEEKFCEVIYRSLHNFRQEYHQSLVIFIAFANSLLNPIIYAFWYPEFRQQLGKLLHYLRINCVHGFKDPLCLR